MNRKDAGIIDAILFQLSNAKNWKVSSFVIISLSFFHGSSRFSILNNANVGCVNPRRIELFFLQ